MQSRIATMLQAPYRMFNWENLNYWWWFMHIKCKISIVFTLYGCSILFISKTMYIVCVREYLPIAIEWIITKLYNKRNSQMKHENRKHRELQVRSLMKCWNAETLKRIWNRQVAISFWNFSYLCRCFVLQVHQIESNVSVIAFDACKKCNKCISYDLKA